jgi:phospholipid N-methyltransferase
MWKNDHMGPLCRVPQTTSQWIDNWKTIMKPFISNPLVIGEILPTCDSLASYHSNTARR